MDALGTSSVGFGANVMAPRASQRGAAANAELVSSHTASAVRKQRLTRTDGDTR